MQNTDEIEISWIFRTLLRWIWLIIACVLVAGFSAFFVTHLITPKYEATTTLLIEPSKDSTSSDYNLLIAAERLALTYIQMVKSQPILDEVAARLLMKIHGKAEISVKAESITDTQLIRLTATDPSPTQAALLANTTAQVLTEYIQSLQAQRYAASLVSIQEQLDEINKKIEETQTQIDSLSKVKTKAESDLSHQETLLAAYRNDFRTLQQTYQDLLLRIDELRNSVNIVQPANVPEDLVNAPYYATVLFLLPNEQLAQTYSQMVTGRSILEAAITQLGLPETPDALASKVSAGPIRGAQLFQLSVRDSDPARAIQIADAIAKAFLSQVQVLLTEPYTNQIVDIQKQIDEYSTKIEQSQKEIETFTAQASQAENEQARLSNLLSEYRSDLRTLQQKYEDLRFVSVQAADSVVIVEPAQVPEKPTQNNLLYIGLATLVGLMIGGGAAFLLETLDDTIKTTDDVSKKLGLSTIGTISVLTNGELGVVVENQPRSPAAESFRVLAMNIRYFSLDKPLRTLLVTSPHPMEGKTLVASNLAAAISQTENKVVVVDADLRLPRLHKRFGIDQGRGLTESLLKNSVDGNLHIIQEDRLSVLTSGEVPPNPTEVIASRSMHHILDKLVEMADFVVIDSPPVLLAADANTLATEVDGVLLVVRAGKTTRRSVKEALESLQQVQANVVGVVLNGVPRRKSYYYNQYQKKDHEKRVSRFQNFKQALALRMQLNMKKK